MPYEISDLPSPPWRTTRLILRPYTEADAETTHRALDQDEAIWRFDPGHARTLEQRHDTIQRFAMLHRQFGFGPCAVFLAEDEGTEGSFIGQGGLNPYIYDQRDETRTVEWEVMYKLARPFWGQGYATEIAQFWVRFAFDVVRLPRLYTCPSKANTKSVAVLKRLGARIETDWLDPETVIATLHRN